MFGDCPGGDSGSWSLAADEGQVPGVPLSPCQAGGLLGWPLPAPSSCPRWHSEGELCAGGIDAVFSSQSSGLSRQSQG